MTQYRDTAGPPPDATPYQRMRAYLKAIGQGPRSGRSLTREEARDALDIIISGDIPRSQMGGFMLLQRFKGETPDELLGFLDAVRARAITIRPAVEGMLDVGSPYDGRKKSIVVSPASSIVAAAAGVPVVMHGEKDLGPKHGVPIGDVLEALGVDVDSGPAEVERQLVDAGLAYMHQSRFVPDLASVRELREEVTLRTVFATVEKIYNLADADYSVIGLTHLPYMEKMLSSASQMGFKRVLLIQGIEGNEDAPTSRPCRAFLSDGGAEPQELRIDASEYGLQAATIEEMEGGDAAYNADIARRIFDREPGAYRDLVLLNAGIRIWLAERAPAIGEGIELAREAIDSGAAKAKLASVQRRAIA